MLGTRLLILEFLGCYFNDHRERLLFVQVHILILILFFTGLNLGASPTMPAAKITMSTHSSSLKVENTEAYSLLFLVAILVTNNVFWHLYCGLNDNFVLHVLHVSLCYYSANS